MEDDPFDFSWVDEQIAADKARAAEQAQLDYELGDFSEPDVITTPSGDTPSSATPSTKTGTATVTTGTKEESATDPIVNGESTVSSSSNETTVNSLEPELSNIVRNPLENFASYTPLWTLAALEKEQYNDPSSYRNDPSALKHIVFSSAGRFDSQRVNTYNGSPEFFIDDFSMTSVVAPTEKTGNTNAVKIEFEVTEPYSMGLFLQSLQNATVKAGYGYNYATAPFVLRLDFKGWDENSTILESVKPKFFPINIIKANFTVSETGSVYKVEAVPFNHKVFGDQINTLYKDSSFSAPETGTVSELLIWGQKSLINMLNEAEADAVKQGKKSKPDIYEIQFPPAANDPAGSGATGGESGSTNSATVNPNAAPSGTTVSNSSSASTATAEDFTGPIPEAKFGFDAADGGNYPFLKEGETVDPTTGIFERDKMLINVNDREFTFTQGQRLTDVITNVILSSEYGKNAILPENLTDAGNVKWFKIDVQMELLDYESTTNANAKKIIFRITPYEVHHTVWANPGVAPLGYKKLAKTIAKRYDYIYTGQNVDVLGFDIEINNLFYSGTTPSSPDTQPNATDSDLNGVVQQDVPETGAGVPQDGKALNPKSPVGAPGPNPNLFNAPVAGGAGKTVELLIAENFQKAIMEKGTGDMINVSLNVVGDTYWIVDSGMGNYYSPKSSSSLITDDGTMSFEGADVYIYIVFRTPADFNEKTGLFDFSKLEKVSPFSGIYKVVQVVSSFNSGQFTQNLTCIRMPQQPEDFDPENVPDEPTPEELFPIKLTGAIKPEPAPTERAADVEPTNISASQVAQAAQDAFKSFDSKLKGLASLVEGSSPVDLGALTSSASGAINDLFASSNPLSALTSDIAGFAQVTEINPLDIAEGTAINPLDALGNAVTINPLDVAGGTIIDPLDAISNSIASGAGAASNINLPTPLINPADTGLLTEGTGTVILDPSVPRQTQ